MLSDLYLTFGLMNLIFLVFFITSLGMGNIRIAWAQTNQVSESQLKEAETSYENGNCSNAILLYSKILDRTKDKEILSMADFRIGYCRFAEGNYLLAKKFFGFVLQYHPDNDEARLKIAQSFLLLGDPRKSQKVAQSIRSQEFLADAAIVQARSFIELENFKAAKNALKPFVNSEAHKAEVRFWLGVVSYNLDQDVGAKKYFHSAEKIAAPESWVKSQSDSWLRRIQGDQQKFHAQLTLGALNDSNIGQSGGYITETTFASGGYSPYYTSDEGGYASLDLIYTAYSSRKLYLLTTLSGSSPFYLNNPSYNLTSASLDTTLKSILSSEQLLSLSLKYLDTWYGGVYYQDYIVFTPAWIWTPTQETWLKLSSPLTSYLNNQQIYVAGLNSDFIEDLFPETALSLGLSLTNSTGPTVTVTQSTSDSTTYTATTGTMFTHYTTIGGYLGLSHKIDADWTFAGTVSDYSTSYQLESLPTALLPASARRDSLISYQLQLTYVVQKQEWFVNLAYTHTQNVSSGFPGLPTYNYVTNYSYIRDYTLLSTTFYY